jgi:hypothetical protein
MKEQQQNIERERHFGLSGHFHRPEAHTGLLFEQSFGSVYVLTGILYTHKKNLMCQNRSASKWNRKKKRKMKLPFATLARRAPFWLGFLFIFLSDVLFLFLFLSLLAEGIFSFSYYSLIWELLRTSGAHLIRHGFDWFRLSQ